MTALEQPRACQSHDGKPKRAYPDRRAARRGARKAERAYGRPLRLYRCPGCTAYHVTTQLPAATS